MRDAEITIFAVLAKWSMLIDRAVLCLLTHLLFLLIGYLLAKDFQQNYHFQLMRKQGSTHRKVIEACIIKSCFEHMKKNQQERKSREICFYFCTETNVTLVNTHICFNLPDSNLESDRIFFPLPIKEKDYFKDWEVFPLSCKNEPVTPNTSKKDFSHLRTVVRHQVPLPLITSGDRVSGDIVEELYRIRKLPVEREFSLLQKYPRAMNCVLFHLHNFENLSVFHQYYYCLCLNERNKEIYFKNLMCKYKLSVYKNKLFSILSETKRIREDDIFDKRGIVVIECKYINELSKLIEHYLSRGRKKIDYTAVRTNNYPFKDVAKDRNADNSNYNLKSYFNNLSTYKNITKCLDHTILISDKKELNKAMLTEQISKNKRKCFDKFHEDNISNKLLTKDLFSSPSKRKRRQISNSKNRDLFKKLINKVKHGNKFLENSAQFNSGEFQVFKKISPSSIHDDNEFLEKSKLKNYFPTLQKVSIPGAIREQNSRSKKSLITSGLRSRTGKEATINTNPVLEEAELSANSRQSASTKSPQQSNKVRNQFKTGFEKESNTTGVIDMNLRETIDAKVNTTKSKLDFSSKNKTSFQTGVGNSKKNATLSTDQLVVHRNTNTTPHNLDEKQITNFPVTLEQRGNSSSNRNDENNEMDYSTSEFGLTRDKLSDKDDVSMKSDSSAQNTDTPYTGYDEAISLGKDIFSESEIPGNIPATPSDVALPTEKLVKTATDISPKFTIENGDMPKTSKNYGTKVITNNPFQFPDSIQETRVTTSDVKTNIDSIFTYRPTTEDNSATTDIKEIISSQESKDSIPSKRLDYDGPTEEDFILNDNTFSTQTVSADFMTTKDPYYDKIFTTSPYNSMTTVSTIQNELHERNYASLPTFEELTFSSKDEDKDYITKGLPVTNLEFSTEGVKDESKYFDVTDTTAKEIPSASKDDVNDYISEDLLVTNTGFSTGLTKDDNKYFGATETTKQSIISSTKDEGKDYFNEDSFVTNMEFSTDAVEDENKYFDGTEATSISNRAPESSSLEFIPKEIPFSTNKVQFFSEEFTEKVTTTSDNEGLSTIEMVNPFSYTTDSKVDYFTDNIEKSFLTTTELSVTSNSDEDLFFSEDKTQMVTSYIDLRQKETTLTSTGTFTNIPSVENEKVEDITNAIQTTKNDVKQDDISTAESINVDITVSVKYTTSIYFDEKSLPSPEESISISPENIPNSITEGTKTSTISNKPNTKTTSDSINDEDVYGTQDLSSSNANILPTSDVKTVGEQDEVSEMIEQEFFTTSETDSSISVKESQTGETSLKIDVETLSTANTIISSLSTLNAEFSSYRTTTSEKTIASRSDYDSPLQTEDFDLSLEEVSNPVETIISSTEDIISSDEITPTEIEMLSTEAETENTLSSENDDLSTADKSTEVEEETLIRTDRDVISASEEYISSLSDETSKLSKKDITTSEVSLLSSSNYSTFPYFEVNGSSNDDNENVIPKTSTERELISSSAAKSVIPNEIWTTTSNNANTEGMKMTPKEDFFSTEDLLSPDKQGLESSSHENEILKISSEDNLFLSSDSSDEAITKTLADDYDENLIATESELFTLIEDDNSSPDDFSFSENVILGQDDKTTSLKEIIRTEREILSSSEDTVPFATENENKDKGIILPITTDVSTIQNYPEFPSENNLNPDISEISPDFTNEDGISDISFEAKGGVSDDVNKGISTEFNFKTPLQTIPLNVGAEGNTELNIIEKTSPNDDVLDVSKGTLPNDVDLPINPDLLGTPNITLPNVNQETEETFPDSTENEENTPLIYLSPIAPKSTDETDYDSEFVSEGDSAGGLITTPKTTSTVFEQYSSSTSDSEKIPQEKSVPVTASSSDLSSDSSERLSSTTSMTSLITSSSDVTVSSTTISSSVKPSTTETPSSVKPSPIEFSSTVKPSTTKSSSSIKPSSTAMSSTELTSSANIADETTTDTTPISFHFTIDADYDEVVGSRKKEFEENLSKQLVVAMRIPFQCLQNLQVSKGSVNVNFELVPSPDHGHMADEKALKAAADELKRMIDNGQLNINDLDGNTLVVIPMDPPTKSPVVNQTENTTLILGVIIGAFILTVISVAIAAIIIKRKANGGHRLTPIEEMRSKLPSYREIQFQEALFVKGSARNKLMYGKYCYNTGKWLGPGPEPELYHAPDSAVYRPPTDSEVRKTPRPPTAVRERLKSDWELDWDSMVSTR